MMMAARRGHGGPNSIDGGQGVSFADWVGASWRRLSDDRTAHPLGAPPDFASSPALALGESVQWRPGTIARPAISCLTARLAPDPSTGLPNPLEDARQVGLRASLAACCPDNLAQYRLRGPLTSHLRGNRTLHPATFVGIKPSPSLSLV